MAVVEVADQVWVATGQIAGTLARPPHPADSRAAARLPDWRAREFVAVRSLLRGLLAEVQPGAAATAIGREPSGQPSLPRFPRLRISLSHDGPRVAAAVARGAGVGVDVQQPPARLADGLLRRCLHGHAELVERRGGDGARTEFAWVWSVQEACVKADGSGLAGRPWTIDVEPWQRTGRWRETCWVSLRDHSEVPLSCAYIPERSPR